MAQDKQHVTVNGLDMAYVEVGEGDPIVFLHGNPTSSHLWRHIIPHVSDLRRCIAPDLIGQGDSQKLPDPGPDSYTFVEHREYLDGLLAAIGVTDNVTFVIHDWGSALGFDWTNRHRDAVAGICFMEAIVKEMRWDDWPETARNIFRGFRSPAGEDLILEKNMFVERILPAGDPEFLTDADMDEYRRPFVNAGEDRRPTLTWPRQIPIEGEPADVCEIVASYGKWMEDPASPPKLHVNVEPGAILVGAQLDYVRTWSNLTEVTVAGGHFVQEFSPHPIGEALRAWLGEQLKSSS